MVQLLCDSVARMFGQEESATTWQRRSAGGTRRLKKLVANQALDIDMLKEISAGNF